MNSERNAFEEAFPIPAHWIEYDEKLNKYYCPYASDYGASMYQARWEAWQASTQRQGYKLVPVDDTNIMDMIYGKCPCGSSRAPIISDKEGYSLIHCFSCGANKYIHNDY